MSDKQYNGWTNYETWLVNLWLSSERKAQAYWLGNAEECLKDVRNDKAQATGRMANYMQEQLADTSPVTSGIYADLITAALSNVNWREVAEHFVDEAKEIA